MRFTEKNPKYLSPRSMLRAGTERPILETHKQALEWVRQNVQTLLGISGCWLIYVHLFKLCKRLYSKLQKGDDFGFKISTGAPAISPSSEPRKASSTADSRAWMVSEFSGFQWLWLIYFQIISNLNMFNETYWNLKFFEHITHLCQHDQMAADASAWKRKVRRDLLKHNLRKTVDHDPGLRCFDGFLFSMKSPRCSPISAIV